MSRFVSFQVEVGVTYITRKGDPVTIMEIEKDFDDEGPRRHDVYCHGDNDITYQIDGVCFYPDHDIVDIA